MYAWEEEKGFLKEKKRYRRQRNAESIYCSEFYKWREAGYRQALVDLEETIRKKAVTMTTAEAEV